MILRHRELEHESGHEAGRSLLREMYREATGMEMPEIEKGPHGKPYFKDSPW